MDNHVSQETHNILGIVTKTQSYPLDNMSVYLLSRVRASFLDTGAYLGLSNIKIEPCQPVPTIAGKIGSISLCEIWGKSILPAIAVK